jgi:clorobiocin biosynthesis protein CloN5
MTAAPLSETDVSTRLIAFIRDRFLGGDPQGEFDETTPLLEWGVLTSLNTAVLINFIRNDLEAPVERMDASSLRDVRSIAAMVCA